VTVEAQNLEDFNTLKVVEGGAQASCSKSLKESERIQLRRDSSTFMFIGTGLGEI
jgi:hypothetical protein